MVKLWCDLLTLVAVLAIPSLYCPKKFYQTFLFFFLKIGVSFASHSHLKMCSLMSTYLKDISGMFVNVVAVNKRLQQATVAGSMIKGAARSDW